MSHTLPLLELSISRQPLFDIWPFTSSSPAAGFRMDNIVGILQFKTNWIIKKA